MSLEDIQQSLFSCCDDDSDGFEELLEVLPAQECARVLGDLFVKVANGYSFSQPAQRALDYVRRHEKQDVLDELLKDRHMSAQFQLCVDLLTQQDAHKTRYLRRIRAEDGWADFPDCLPQNLRTLHKSSATKEWGKAVLQAFAELAKICPFAEASTIITDIHGQSGANGRVRLKTIKECIKIVQDRLVSTTTQIEPRSPAPSRSGSISDVREIDHNIGNIPELALPDAHRSVVEEEETNPTLGTPRNQHAYQFQVANSEDLSKSGTPSRKRRRPDYTTPSPSIPKTHRNNARLKRLRRVSRIHPNVLGSSRNDDSSPSPASSPRRSFHSDDDVEYDRSIEYGRNIQSSFDDGVSATFELPSLSDDAQVDSPPLGHQTLSKLVSRAPENVAEVKLDEITNLELRHDLLHHDSINQAAVAGFDGIGKAQHHNEPHAEEARSQVLEQASHPTNDQRQKGDQLNDAIVSGTQHPAIDLTRPPQVLTATDHYTTSRHEETEKAVWSLISGQRLNDVAINSSLRFLLASYSDCQVIDSLNIVSVALPKVQDGTRLLFCPVHHSKDEHWTMLVINLMKRHQHHLDSLPSERATAEAQEYARRIIRTVTGGEEHSLHQTWTWKTDPSPRQINPVDCGTFALLNAIGFLDEISLPNFGDMSSWRMIFATMLSNSRTCAMPVAASTSNGPRLARAPDSLDELYEHVVKMQTQLRGRITAAREQMKSLQAARAVFVVLLAQNKKAYDAAKDENVRFEDVFNNARQWVQSGLQFRGILSSVSRMQEELDRYSDSWKHYEQRLAELHDVRGRFEAVVRLLNRQVEAQDVLIKRYENGDESVQALLLGSLKGGAGILTTLLDI